MLSLEHDISSLSSRVNIRQIRSGAGDVDMGTKACQISALEVQPLADVGDGQRGRQRQPRERGHLQEGAAEKKIGSKFLITEKECEHSSDDCVLKRHRVCSGSSRAQASWQGPM